MDRDDIRDKAILKAAAARDTALQAARGEANYKELRQAAEADFAAAVKAADAAYAAEPPAPADTADADRADADRAIKGLESINGIGPVTAGKLRAAGVPGLDALARLTTGKAAELGNAGLDIQADWIRDAQRLVGIAPEPAEPEPEPAAEPPAPTPQPAGGTGSNVLQVIDPVFESGVLKRAGSPIPGGMESIRLDVERGLIRFGGPATLQGKTLRVVRGRTTVEGLIVKVPDGFSVLVDTDALKALIS